MAISKRTGVIGGGAAALAAASITMFTLLSSNAVRVAPGEDLQAAINAAACGAVIEVDAGTAYPTNLTLPAKNCTEFITVQSSRASELPEGVRIDPVAQAPLFATLESVVNAEPVIKTATAAHHYKFIGVHIKTQSTSVFVYDLVRFGNGRPEQSALESVPHHLVLDRSWVEGNGEQPTQRGVSLNCADCGVMNSVVNNIKAQGMDTQAICGWNGTLRAFIINNYLEAGAEIVMMGGSDPAQESMTPRLVEVRRNTIRRPMEWKGKGYTIKNLVEAKNVIGFTIDGNLMENNWGNEGQSGPCLLATVRNQEGSAPYSIITNYVVTNNIVRNCEGVFNFLGTDNEKPSQRGSGALISNNVFDKIYGHFITLNGFLNVTVENNTDLQTCSAGCDTILLYGEPSSNFIHRNNAHDEKAYGLFGDGGTNGQAALDRYAPDAVVTGNVIAHPYSPWPTGNQAVESLTITSDYRTPYDGKGANVDDLLAAQAGSGTSQPSPSATATVAVSPSPSASPSATVLNGIPVASTVEVTSAANVRAAATINSPEKFIAPADLRGTTTGVCQRDTAGGVNVYCPVTFTDSTSGFVAMQFLRVVSATPSPTATPTSTPTPATPTPTPTATPTATPRPSPSPTATPLPFCRSGQRPGTPPVCKCRNGMIGNSGKCR